MSKKFRKPRELRGYFHMRGKELPGCGPNAPDGLGVITISGRPYKVEARKNTGGDFNLWLQQLGPDGRPLRGATHSPAPMLRRFARFLTGEA